MKNPFETLIIPGGILLLGFLSALLLPAPSFGLIWAQRLQQSLQSPLPAHHKYFLLFRVLFCDACHRSSFNLCNLITIT